MIDVLIIIFFVVFAICGIFRGFVREIISLLGLIVAFLVATYFSHLISFVINLDGKYSGIVYFIITFVLVLIIFCIIAKITKKIVASIGLGCLDKMLGLVVGGIKGLLIAAAILSFGRFLDRNEKFINKENIEKSKLYQPLTDISSVIFLYIKDTYAKCEDAIKKEKDNLDKSTPEQNNQQNEDNNFNNNNPEKIKLIEN